MKRDHARSAAAIVLQLLLLCSTPQVLLGLSKSKSKLQYCERPHSRCLDMNHSLSCLGVKLPYTSTSMDLVPDAETPEEAQVHIFIYHNHIMRYLYGVRSTIGRIRV